MSILKIARMGHPILRQKAEAIPPDVIKSKSIQKLISDLIETVKEYDGAGLAAPQVHESLQLCILGMEANPRYPNEAPIPLTVLINPEIKFLTDEKIYYWEGCLSLPNIRGYVPRCKKIEITAYNQHGEKNTWIEDGFNAIVTQHETDHLLGKLYIDRVEDTTKLTFFEEYIKYVV